MSDKRKRHDNRPPPGSESEQQINDLRRLMDTDYGRRFVWRLLGQAGTFQLSFTGNSETFFNEGRRSLGTELYGQLHEHCLDQYLVMMHEAKEKEEDHG